MSPTASKENENDVIPQGKQNRMNHLSFQIYRDILICIHSVFVLCRLLWVYMFILYTWMSWLSPMPPSPWSWSSSPQEHLIHFTQGKLNLAKGAFQSREFLLIWEPVKVILCQLGPAWSWSFQSCQMLCLFCDKVAVGFKRRPSSLFYSCLSSLNLCLHDWRLCK